MQGSAYTNTLTASIWCYRTVKHQRQLMLLCNILRYKAVTGNGALHENISAIFYGTQRSPGMAHYIWISVQYFTVHSGHREWRTTYEYQCNILRYTAVTGNGALHMNISTHRPELEMVAIEVWQFHEHEWTAGYLLFQWPTAGYLSLHYPTSHAWYRIYATKINAKSCTCWTK